MKHPARLTPLAAAVPLAFAALLPATAAAAPKPIKFTAVEYHSTQKGNTLAFQEHFVSAGRTIGHDSISCAESPKTLSCTGTFFFTSGTLRIRAAVGRGKFNRGTVVSGTGRYAGLKGSFTLTDLSDTKTAIAITLT
jgi:hypothetical protein